MVFSMIKQHAGFTQQPRLRKFPAVAALSLPLGSSGSPATSVPFTLDSRFGRTDGLEEFEVTSGFGSMLHMTWPGSQFQAVPWREKRFIRLGRIWKVVAFLPFPFKLLLLMRQMELNFWHTERKDRRKVGLALQRGNVASILGTLPPGKELEELFY